MLSKIWRHTRYNTYNTLKLLQINQFIRTCQQKIAEIIKKDDVKKEVFRSALHLRGIHADRSCNISPHRIGARNDKETRRPRREKGNRR